MLQPLCRLFLGLLLPQLMWGPFTLSIIVIAGSVILVVFTITVIVVCQLPYPLRRLHRLVDGGVYSWLKTNTQIGFQPLW
jgi:hypothetical protein